MGVCCGVPVPCHLKRADRHKEIHHQTMSGEQPQRRIEDEECIVCSSIDHFVSRISMSKATRKSESPCVSEIAEF